MSYFRQETSVRKRQGAHREKSWEFPHFTKLGHFLQTDFFGISLDYINLGISGLNWAYFLRFAPSPYTMISRSVVRLWNPLRSIHRKGVSTWTSRHFLIQGNLKCRVSCRSQNPACPTELHNVLKLILEARHNSHWYGSKSIVWFP